VVTDYNDFSREFMRRLEHVMFVEAPTLNPAMLGRREWLRHIVRHEFTHAVQYAATGARYGPVGEWVGMAHRRMAGDIGESLRNGVRPQSGFVPSACAAGPDRSQSAAGGPDRPLARLCPGA